MGTPPRIGLTRREMAFGTQEQQRRFAFFWKSGDVRAVRINLRRAHAGRDVNFWQTAVAAAKVTRPGISYFRQVLGKADGFHKTREV